MPNTLQDTILWLRYDLRTKYNPALEHALKTSSKIILLFIWDDKTFNLKGPGLWFYLHAVAALQQKLSSKYQININILAGDPQELLPEIASRYRCSQVVWNRVYQKSFIKQDSLIKAGLKAKGVKVITFNGELLVDPIFFLDYHKKPYQNFSKFKAAYFTQASPFLKQELDLSASLAFQFLTISEQKVTDLTAAPTQLSDKLIARLKTDFPLSDSAAHQAAQDFFRNKLLDYEKDTKEISLTLSSKLSTSLRFGLINPKYLPQLIKKFHSQSATTSHRRFIDSLLKRDFCYYAAYHNLNRNNPLASEANNRLTDQVAEERLRKFQQGKTGVPIIDAAIAQIHTTGFISYPLRVLCASFFTKILGLPWSQGALFFMTHLLDADETINNYYWQQEAGLGLAATSPLERTGIIKHSKIYDPQGKYIKNWLPKLVRCPKEELHMPGQPEKYDYPPPMLDLKIAEQAFW